MEGSDAFLFSDNTSGSSSLLKLTPDMARQVLAQADKEQLFLTVAMQTDSGAIRLVKSSKVSDAVTKVLTWVTEICSLHNDQAEEDIAEAVVKLAREKYACIHSPNSNGASIAGTPRLSSQSHGRFVSREEPDGRVVVTFFPGEDASKQSARFSEAYRVEKRVASYLMTERWSKQWAEMEKDGRPPDWPQTVEFTSPYKMSRQVTQEFIRDCLKWAASCGQLHILTEARTRMGDVKRPGTAQWFFDILASLGFHSSASMPRAPVPSIPDAHSSSSPSAAAAAAANAVLSQPGQSQSPTDYHTSSEAQNLIFHLMQAQQMSQHTHGLVVGAHSLQQQQQQDTSPSAVTSPSPAALTTAVIPDPDDNITEDTKDIRPRKRPHIDSVADHHVMTEETNTTPNSSTGSAGNNNNSAIHSSDVGAGGGRVCNCVMSCDSNRCVCRKTRRHCCKDCHGGRHCSNCDPNMS